MSAPDRDQFNWISQEVIDAHIAWSQAKTDAEAAGIFDDDEPVVYDLGDGDDAGFGPGSYFERAMSKDD